MGKDLLYSGGHLEIGAMGKWNGKMNQKLTDGVDPTFRLHFDRRSNPPAMAGDFVDILKAVCTWRGCKAMVWEQGDANRSEFSRVVMHEAPQDLEEVIIGKGKKKKKKQEVKPKPPSQAWVWCD